MQKPPTWFLPVAIVALLWNLIGCAAYLSDVMMSPEKLAAMSAAEQALYASRPTWAVAATAIAVWFGAAGSLGLVLRKRWAMPLLIVSLLGVIVQDAWLFLLSDAASQTGSTALVMQGLVLVISVGLVLLARTAAAREWIG